MLNRTPPLSRSQTIGSVSREVALIPLAFAAGFGSYMGALKEPPRIPEDILLNREWDESQSGFSGYTSGIFFIGKKTESLLFAVDIQSDSPLSCFLMPRNPPVLRCTTASGNILSIHFLRYDAKIFSPVVELIPVNVISFKVITRGKLQDLSVQVENPQLPAPAITFAAYGIADPSQEPAPLIDPVGVSDVDQCVGSNAAVTGAERDADSGIIKAHRTLHRSGVVPPAVHAAWGLSVAGSIPDVV